LTTVASPIGDPVRVQVEPAEPLAGVPPFKRTGVGDPPTALSPLSRGTLVEQGCPYGLFQKSNTIPKEIIFIDTRKDEG